MGGDRKREIWPCPYDMGQNFYFYNKSCHPAWRARVLPRGFSQGRRAEKYEQKWRPKLPLQVKLTLAFFHQFLFLIYVKVSLSTSLNVAMKVRMIQVIRMSAVVYFFGQIQSRRLVRHVRGITQWSRQFTKRFTAHRYGQPKNTE